MLRNLLTFIFYVKQMVLLYSATAMKPALKDMMLRIFGVPLLSDHLAQLQGTEYTRKPENCSLPSGLRAYGAAGVRVRICDLCRTRYVLDKKGQAMLATPKTSPTARTPLNIPDNVLNAIKGKAGPSGAAVNNPSHASSRPSSTSSQGFVPPRRLTRPMSTATSSMAAASFLKADAKNPPRASRTSVPLTLRRRQWRGSDSDRMSTGAGVYNSDMDWTEAHPETADPVDMS
ncbi:unnamed protein product [Symbiodinium sp. CCMP2456]|nr:unnamed protein product [Symbiodinium sp. CCMP2456]